MSNQRDGVVIGKGTVGADAQNKTDGISAILASGVAVDGGLALGTTVKLTSVRDAEAQGITAAYDATNKVRVYRHITEFYRMAGEGLALYLMLFPQTILPDVAITSLTYGKKLIADAGGVVKLFALVWNPPADYAPTYVDGMEANIRTAIPAAQTFCDWADTTFRPVHLILEGRGINVASATALDLTAITIAGNAVQYNQVTAFIAQDWDYAETQDAIGKKMADVGTYMGALAGRAVNENPGEVGAVNITDTKKLKWLNAGISSHTRVKDIEADLNEWANKAYALAWDYQSEAVSGFRFSGDPVCAPVINDGDGNLNESSIALSRTNAKVRRALRDAYLPKVRSVQKLQADTGLLPIGRIKALEGIGNDVFKGFESLGIISGGITTIDRNSNLLSGDKSLGISYQWVPEGTIGLINGIVNIKSTLS
jgi:hypothetical protein